MMKSIFVSFMLIVSITAFSQQIVVGVISRTLSNSNNIADAQDYYWSISVMEDGSEYQMKNTKEASLKKYSKYNWMTDFTRAYVGNEGESYLIIIKSKHKFGVGFGSNKDIALEQAVDRLKRILYVSDISNYEILHSQDYSNELGSNQESEASDFSLNPDGTIYDKNTNLEWYCPNKDMTWTDAKEFGQRLDLSGGRWRLPTRSELYNLWREELSHEAHGHLLPMFRISSMHVWINLECETYWFGRVRDNYGYDGKIRADIKRGFLLCRDRNFSK